MKKTDLILLPILLFCSCVLFQPKTAPYPEGVIFPVQKSKEILYEGEILTHISRKNERLYFATRKGFIYCFDGRNYTVLWRLQMQERPASPIFMGKNHFYIFDLNSSVYCFDLEGQPLWQITLEENISSPLVEIGESLFLGTTQGSFIAVDVTSGEEGWHFSAGDAIRSNPVVFEGNIIFGCDDHFLYYLDKNGQLVDKYEAEDKIGNTLLLDQNFLYFGTENHFFFCLDLRGSVQRWKVKTGGHVIPYPVADENRVYFLAWNNVLYCLNKRSGSILWWRAIPSRSVFQLEIVDDRIMVSSMSSVLICFDVENGANVGQMDVLDEIKSNPLWNPPYLLVNTYDRQTETGRIVLMEKVIDATLTPSLASPRVVNEEISFSVSTFGFHRPEYEFYVKTGEEKEIVQEKSERSVWSWFPSRPDSYTIGVTVRDERETREAEVSFVINKIKPQIKLFSEKRSPQVVGEKIAFTTTATGMVDPQFIVRINRISLGFVGRRSIFFIQRGDSREMVPALSETNEWTWVPELEGLYLIHVLATDSEERTEKTHMFLITLDKDLNKSAKIKKEGAS